jgi:hypothetical protein
MANKRCKIATRCFRRILKGFVLCLAINMKALQSRTKSVEQLSVLFDDHAKSKPETHRSGCVILFLHGFCDCSHGLPVFELHILIFPAFFPKPLKLLRTSPRQNTFRDPPHIKLSPPTAPRSSPCSAAPVFEFLPTRGRGRPSGFWSPAAATARRDRKECLA